MAYAGATSAGRPRAFGRSGLGTRRQRFWFGVAGLIALGLPYLSMAVASIRAGIDIPAPPVALPAISTPLPRLPQIGAPAAMAHPVNAARPGAAVPVQATAPGRAVTTSTTHRVTRRLIVHRSTVRHSKVPVITSSYTTAPTPAASHVPTISSGSASGLAGALNAAPIVLNSEPVPT
ncbi:MAG TPA: hypothetical protein VF781_03100, partial [Solirubrobacteraceae bacterium]